MTTQSLWLTSADHLKREPDSGLKRASVSRARKENLVAFAFAIFSAAILSLTLLPPRPPADPTQVDALEIVAGP